MNYIVKSKKELNELMNRLEKEEISFQLVDEHALDIHLPDKEKQEVFIQILSVYLADTNVQELLVKHFIKKGKTVKQAQKLMKKVLSEIIDMEYFYVLTKVLVKEYLKKMNTLHIESFSLFNMKGFKEEVNHFIQRHLEKTKKEDDEEIDEINEMEVKEMNIQDYFAFLKKKAVKNGLNLDDCKELHVVQQGNSLILKNKENVVLDDDFLLDYFGSVIRFEVLEEIENAEFFEGAVLLSFFIQMFETEKVVIHKSVTEKAKEILLYHLTSLKKETGMKIKIIVCEGCETCE
jgi:uncharacterized protein YukJ